MLDIIAMARRLSLTGAPSSFRPQAVRRYLSVAERPDTHTAFSFPPLRELTFDTYVSWHHELAARNDSHYGLVYSSYQYGQLRANCGRCGFYSGLMRYYNVCIEHYIRHRFSLRARLDADGRKVDSRCLVN